MELPATRIVRQNITSIIQTRPFEFVIHASVYGEVLRVENLFLDLPEAAQRLMLGQEYEKMLPKIESYGQLFRYKVPLAVNDFLEDAALQPLIEALQKRRNELNLPKRNRNDKDNVQDTWTRQFFEDIYPKRESEYFDVKKTLESIQKLFQTPPDYGNGLVVLGNKKYPFLGEIITDIIPLLKRKSTFGYAYKAMEFFPSERNKKILLEAFEAHKNNHTGHRNLIAQILTGLSAYTSEDVYKLVIDYYRNVENPHDYISAAIIKCLKNFQNEEVIDIAWENYLGQREVAGGFARQILETVGVTEIEFTKKLNPLFKDKNKIKHWQNISNQYHHIKNDELLPPVSAFLDALEISLQHDVYLLSTIAGHLEKLYDSSVHDRIYKWLFSEDEKFLRTATSQIDLLIMNRKSNFQPSKKMVKRLLELTYLEGKDIPHNAIRSLSYCSQIIEIKDFTKIMVERIEEGDIEISVACINALRKYFSYNPYDSRIESTIKNCLNADDFRLRRTAIGALMNTDSTELRQKVKSMQNDPDKRVRDAAQLAVGSSESYERTVELMSKLEPSFQKWSKVKPENKNRMTSFPVKENNLGRKILNFLKKIFK